MYDAKIRKINIGDALFLDRDGVLNQLIEGDYVRNPDQLVILPGAVEAVAMLTPLYKHIFIVTNQSGIGRGYFTTDDLALIHQKLLDAIESAGGHIDHIFFCPSRPDEGNLHRKPGVGMALEARHAYPDIRLRRSLMIGDSLTDMLFGKHSGMQTILVGPRTDIARNMPHLVDYSFCTLLDAARYICQASSDRR